MTSPIFEEIFRIISEAPLYHLIVEIALFILLLYFIWQKSYNPKEAMGLTKEEQEKLIDEWQPEDLVSDVPQDHVALKPHIISGKAEKYMIIDGTRCLNLASHNYLGLIGNKEIEDEAITTVRKYGVGSCGPRGFYGTVDVHLLLEERLARFTHREQAVVYSYNFSTIASAIPAYCKRNDIIFVDENVNFAIQKGLEASRSDVRFFKHNDPADLERLLKHQHMLDLQNPKKAAATRRFLVVEGIYINSGDICPLPEIIKLRYQYKFRIIMDESVSLGSIGSTGRGVTEYYDIPVEEVDMISGNMEYALGTIGGFCVGSCFFVEHQRLAGLGYCFSASLPPLLAAAAIVGLDLIENNPDMFPRLQSRCRLAHKMFEALPQMILKGDPDSPVKHLHLKKKCCCEACMNFTLHQITNNCIKQGVAFAVAEYLPVDKYPEKGSIRFTVNKDLEEDDLKQAFEMLKKACEEEIKCDPSSLPSSLCSVDSERQNSSHNLQWCDRGTGSHYCGRLSSLIMLPQAL